MTRSPGLVVRNVVFTVVVPGLGGAWLLVRARKPDLLGQIDQDLPAGHTHHLSAAQRVVGDAVIAVGPRPGRKWAGVGLAALSLPWQCEVDKAR